MRIVDIIWLPHIIDKLAWKHRVEPEEVDQVLFSKALILSARDMDAKERKQYGRKNKRTIPEMAVTKKLVSFGTTTLWPIIGIRLSRPNLKLSQLPDGAI